MTSKNGGGASYIWVRLHPDTPPLLMLVDSGADHSVLPKTAYYAISKGQRPKLEPPEIHMTAVNNTKVGCLGKIDLEIMIENKTYAQTFHISSEEVIPLLGRDFMFTYDVLDRPARNLLLISDVPVTAYTRDGLQKSALVTAKRDIHVPAGARLVVKARVCGRHIIEGKPYCMETTKNLFPRTGAVAAKVIVVVRAKTVPVELFNPMKVAATIPQGMILGVLEEATDTKDWSPSEASATNNLNMTTQEARINRLSSEPIKSVSLPAGDIPASHTAKTLLENRLPREVPECIAESQEENLEKGSRLQREVPGHVKELYEESREYLDTFVDGELRELLCDFDDIFAVDNYDLGRSTTVTHRIDTGDERPVRQRPRRQPQMQFEEMKSQVTNLHKAGIIRPSTSCWGSSVLLVRKKDGKWRMCVDYRELNAKTKNNDPYMLPRIDDTIDSLGRAKFFCCLDLLQGFHQIELDEESKQKTAFITPRMTPSQWEYNCMPFGISGGPATFQRLMDRLLSGLEYRIALAYLDDIIVFGKDAYECVCRLRIVFQRIREAGLKLKAKKCELFRKEILYLGYIISAEGIKTDPKKVEAIRAWQTPRTPRQVQVFLGTMNYYNRFIKDFSETARPLYALTKLTKVKGKYIWTPECEEAYQTLRQKLMEAPIMSYPRDTGLWVLDTDASGYAIGGVLSQMQVQDDGTEQEKVIAYGSRTLQGREQRYCTRRRELLAIVYFVKMFRSYIWGRHTLIRTDHASLKYLKTLRDPDDQFARWIEGLEEVDYEIEIRKGTTHANADGLSRLGCAGKKCICPGVADLEASGDTRDFRGLWIALDDKIEWVRSSPEASLEEDALPGAESFIAALLTDATKSTIAVFRSTELPRETQTPAKLAESRINAFSFAKLWTREEMAQEQQADADIGPVYAAMLLGERPAWNEISLCSEATKSYFAEWRRLELYRKMLYRRWESLDGSESYWQLLIPHKYQQLMLVKFHDDRAAAHMGKKRALGQLRRRAFWFQMSEDVKLWIQTCDVCQKRKKPGRSPKAPMVSFQTGEVNERVSLDICGPLLTTKAGNSYILVVTDQYTKFTRAFPMPNGQAPTVAQYFHTGWICLFGAPRQFHSDRGTNFDGKVVHGLCELFNIEKTRTTPYHPQGDGQVERYNSTMGALLNALVRADVEEWDEYLAYCAYAYNSTKHATTGIEPNLLVFGRHVYMPFDVSVPPSPADEALPQNEYVRVVRERLRKAHILARQTIGRSAKSIKKYNDRRTHLNHYETGDAVLLKHYTRTPLIGKLEDRYGDVHYVVDVLSDVTLRIARKGEEPKIVHHDKLKPYHSREPEHDLDWVYKLSRKYRLANNREIGVQTDDTPAEDAGLLQPIHQELGLTAEPRAAENIPVPPAGKQPVRGRTTEQSTETRPLIKRTRRKKKKAASTVDVADAPAVPTQQTAATAPADAVVQSAQPLPQRQPRRRGRPRKEKGDANGEPVRLRPPSHLCESAVLTVPLKKTTTPDTAAAPPPSAVAISIPPASSLARTPAGAGKGRTKQGSASAKENQQPPAVEVRHPSVFTFKAPAGKKTERNKRGPDGLKERHVVTPPEAVQAARQRVDEELRQFPRKTITITSSADQAEKQLILPRRSGRPRRNQPAAAPSGLPTTQE